jgi:hypothetical protein
MHAVPRLVCVLTPAPLLLLLLPRVCFQVLSILLCSLVPGAPLSLPPLLAAMARDLQGETTTLLPAASGVGEVRTRVATTIAHLPALL